jgi:hypothetical protein
VLSILLAIVFSVFLLYKKDSKLYYFLFCIYIWILFGWNNSNADLKMYENNYENISLNNLHFIKYEGGYDFLMFCFKKIGLTFLAFRVIISGIIMTLFLRFVNFFSKDKNLFIVCFFYFFFPLQYVIFRNFIAFVIVLIGLEMILNDKKYSKAKFIFFVLLASTIHISSLFYLIFLVAFKKDQLNIKKMISIVIGLLLFVIFIDKYIYLFISAIHNQKAIFYKPSLILFLSYSAIQFVNLFVVKYFLYLDQESKTKEELTKLELIILNINIAMLLLIPIYYEVSGFIRILLNFSVVNTLFIANAAFIKGKEVFPKLLFFMYLLFWFIAFIFFVRQDTIIPLFKNNFLLN